MKIETTQESRFIKYTAFRLSGTPLEATEQLNEMAARGWRLLIIAADNMAIMVRKG